MLQRFDLRPRLPRLLPYVPRPDDPAIFWFNSERDDVVREVADRVVHRHQGSRESLELTLNEVAYHESRRLEAQRDHEAKEGLGYWRGLLRRIGRMNNTEKLNVLREITTKMTRDVAGNFDPRVYHFSERIVPKLLTGVMSPTDLPAELLTPGRSRLETLVQADGDLEHLRRLAKIGTLILVPTHSSNLDSIVIAYCLQRHGLPPVVYGAGKNLFTNPIISFFMHNLGAYRVDRRIRSALYKEVLKTYSCVLLERGYHSLFFPGGTRSRSGLIESHLKLGLAGTGIEAFANNQVHGVARPVFFVPVTINYALVLEAETLIEDHLAEHGKARYIIEDDEFSRIERWVAFLRELVGLTSACVVRFGRPVDPFGNDVNDDGTSLASGGRPIDAATYVWRRGKPTNDPARDRAYTRELGDLLSERFRQETVIMSTQLVAHVLFRRLVRDTPGLDLFARLRHRNEIAMAFVDLCQEVGVARDALISLASTGQVHVSPFIASRPPEEIVTRALRAFDGFHTRTAARRQGAEVIAEDPTLLLYYQNRLVPFATTIASPGYAQAAVEIERQGASPWQ